MEPTRDRRRAAGFSLLEAVIVLAVLALLVRTAMPSFDGMLSGLRLNAASQDLLGDLHLARSEALSRNRRVTLCKSSDGATCAPGGDWEQGWLVFEDSNHSGRRDLDEPVIARHVALAAGLRLAGNGNVDSYVSYTGQGTTRLVNGGFQAGTLTVCRSSGGTTDARQVVVNSVGRPRVQRAVVASCA